MCRFGLVTCVVLAACGGATPAEPARSVVAAPRNAPAQVPDPARCEPPPADASERWGEFVFTHGYSDFHLYRVDAAGCAKLIATLDTGGPFAFAAIGEAPGGGMPDLRIETWLMHGDRRSTIYVWSAGRYVDTGHSVEILGPRKRPR